MSELSITTTQNVNINFTTASVGERVLAYLLDIVIIMSYYGVVLFLIFSIFDMSNFTESDGASVMAVYGLISLPVVFYALFFENLMEGQTVGKKILKIKVIKIDGYQSSFADYLIRWLFRIIEVTPPFSFIGLIVMIINDKTQRIGDMAAGTAVITLKNKININHTILTELKNDYVPTYPLVIKLTDNDVRIIKETYDTALKSADYEIIAKLVSKIESVTGIKSVSNSNMAFVSTIIKDYNYYTQNM
ncbi:RDD family protein [Flavobacterium beibuense]|uniref:Transporter n=1 Tax=Flavobacterium beibuense F44-8 TaxID=1406840 RepID=A0A0A2LRZ5_9FLAO|nr:RDD family protein [Flavobacterium beibuense]KGO82043.1 transporter [Flavobacterium beibuense F44-8]